VCEMSSYRQPFSRAVYAAKKTASTSKPVPESLRAKVDMTKVTLEVMKPWIATRVTELLGVEDEVLIGMIIVLLEESKVHANALHIREQLSTFLEKHTDEFMVELWDLLASAQANPSGVPAKFLADKARDIERSNAAAEKMRRNQDEYARRKRDDARGGRFDDRRRRPYDRRDRRSRSRSRERTRRESRSPPRREEQRRERPSRWEVDGKGDAPKVRSADET